jgi:hypothetical protein
MATNWQALQSGSAADKANWYSQQVASGQNDAQIRAAVSSNLGVQSSSDWQYLQSLAGYSAPSAAPAPAPTPSYAAPTPAPQPDYYAPAYTPAPYVPPAPVQSYAAPAPAPATPSFNLSSLQSATPQAKADWYSQQRASGQSDAQIRAAATNAFGAQTDTDWQHLMGLSGAQSAMTSVPTQDQGKFYNGLMQNINSTDWQVLQSGTPQQKADWYSSLSANRGLSDGAIRAIAEKSVGKQSDTDWAALQKMAGVDNPMPLSYMAQLPELQASSTNAVNYALQQAIAASQRNGYDPESSWQVNTLRGYFSDDPQAKANALLEAERYAQQLIPGAYRTADYGHAGIAGFNQQFETPTFKSAYNQQWNTPTLYDMINSTIGWSAQNNNYADPSKRTAELNRKLTDDEIRAFQSGRLTPALQSVVSQYRGGTSGGTPTSGGVGGGVSGGVSTGGFTAGANGAPSTGINLNQLQGTTPWTVQPNQTVQAQLQQIIASDSPLMQQARTRALQTANGRGLLNSTMSQTAADSAMYDAAFPIAAADAGLYGEAARFNADASNTFSRDNNAFTRDAFMADFNLAANEWAKQQDQVRTLSTMDYESRLTLDRDAIQNGYQSARDAIQNGYAINADTRKFNWQSKENALTRDTEGKVTQSQQATIDANTKADARAQIVKARQDLTSRLLGIEEAGNLSTEAKDTMIDKAVDGYQTIVQAHIAESGWTGASADVWNYTAA